MNQELSNFIKYCLGYVKITREKTAFSQQNYSVDLNEEQFNIISLLNGTEGDLEEPIKLECFYEYDPKQVPPKLYKKYTEEKKIANGIEEIYNKHKNDQYTKQVLLNFGHFKIEIPKYEDIEINDEDAEDGNNRDGNFLDAKTDVKNYPLFTLPIRIDKCNSKGSLGKYVVNFIDDEIRVNIGVLYSILGEDKYHQLLEKIGQYEINGKLSIPICKKDVFIEIWQDVKSLLKLENINFDDNSFDLDAIRISLGPKANYFLAEDLEKLIKAKDEELEASSLFSWVSNLNEDLNIVNQNVQSNTTYFPFPYDKFQLSTLSIISNKASIIQGPPGTGKSETIANILCHLAANKKKILFVSQKPQALKVVKDKLKRLKVQYLFGYIPNLNSELLDDDDMNDGVSAQLGNLNNYIDVLENKKKSTDGNLLHRFNSIVTTENKLVDKFNQILSTQRRLNYLHKQIEGLSKYELKIDNHDDFINNFTLSNEKAIRYLYDKLDSLIELNAEFVNSIGKTKYKSLEILHYEDSNLVDKLEKILRDVEQTGYDRHSKLGRKLVNAWRWFRIGNIFEMLPRELADFVKSILELDLSRIDATKELKNLIEYFNFKNREFAIHTVLQMIAEKLKLCGLTRDQFLEIEKLLNSATEDKRQELLNKIRDLIILKKEVSNLELTDSCNSVELMSNVVYGTKQRILLTGEPPFFSDFWTLAS
ncbi:MAG: hypothetical protein LLG37_03340 [Spirochaetia bacterium]|nr:hypothetical protein [Spirochaetia bacterium]